MVFCLDQAYDTDNLTRFGHDPGYYLRGSTDGKKFGGWNAQFGDNTTACRKELKRKSSQEILDEVLVFEHNFRQKVVKEAFFIGQDHEIVEPEMNFRTLAHPFGRCLVISPPLKEKKFSKINPNVLSLHLHQMDRGKKIKEKIKIKTYFMAKIASLQLYPDELEMTSDRPQIRLWEPVT